jgi:hypothetical protein
MSTSQINTSYVPKFCFQSVYCLIRYFLIRMLITKCFDTLSACVYTTFTPEPLLRNSHEHRPSNDSDLDCQWGGWESLLHWVDLFVVLFWSSLGDCCWVAFQILLVVRIWVLTLHYTQQDLQCCLNGRLKELELFGCDIYEKLPQFSCQVAELWCSIQ